MSAPFLEEHLRTLHLPTVLQNYKRLAQGDDARINYLGELSSLEVSKRHENGVRAKILAAKFPVIKTMESFDFTLQPELPRRKLTELLDCKFIDEKRNVVFIGTTGVGKTHLLTAIGRNGMHKWISRALCNGSRTAHVTHCGKTRRSSRSTSQSHRAIPFSYHRRARIYSVRTRGNGSLVSSDIESLRARQHRHHNEPRVSEFGRKSFPTRWQQAQSLIGSFITA